MSNLAPLFYLLIMVGAGWFLARFARPLKVRLVLAVALVVPVPLLFLGPVIKNPQNEFASLQIALGLTTLIWGAVALAAGWSGRVLIRRWQDRR